MTTRLIPILLLTNNGLVKTLNFQSPRYVGDPINAVKIFNTKEVDELVFLDISKERHSDGPNYQQIKEIASEAFMPFGYGGGITTLQQAEKIFSIGVEKIIINSSFWANPRLVSSIAEKFGEQSVVVSIDVKKKMFGGYSVFSHSGNINVTLSPLEAALKAEEYGAGEIILNSIDKDGTLSGYDLDLIKSVATHLKIPLVASGGGSSIENFKEALNAGADALAAGAFFVFHGKHKAILITYPNVKL